MYGFACDAKYQQIATRILEDDINNRAQCDRHWQILLLWSVIYSTYPKGKHLPCNSKQIIKGTQLQSIHSKLNLERNPK